MSSVNANEKQLKEGERNNLCCKSKWKQAYLLSIFFFVFAKMPAFCSLQILFLKYVYVSDLNFSFETHFVLLCGLCYYVFCNF